MADQSRHRRRPRITERDLDLLRFVAEHRIVLAGHVEKLLGVSAAAASGRLRALCAAGLLSQTRLFHRQPTCFQVTRTGLGLIGSRLPPPRLDIAQYRHDVGVAWLWLAARAGTFGPMREVIGERQLRSRDGTREPGRDPLALRLSTVGPGGGERLRYPDLLLVTADGRRVAVELELTSKGRTRRERILAGYAADPRIDAVVYLAESPAIRRQVSESARRLGISELVHVQRVRGPEVGPRAGVAPALERAPHRAAAVAL